MGFQGVNKGLLMWGMISPKATQSMAFRASFPPAILRSFTNPDGPAGHGALKTVNSTIDELKYEKFPKLFLEISKEQYQSNINYLIKEKVDNFRP